MITQRGFETSSNACVARARRELVFTPLSGAPGMPQPRAVRAYVDLGNGTIIAPQFWEPARAEGAVVDTRSEGADIECTFAGTLREDLRQPDAVRAVMAAWEKSGGAVLALPTGYGKTACALYLVAHLKKKTLVFVSKNFLKDQWAERASAFVPSAKISFVQGPVWDESGDIVVAMVQTVVARKGKMFSRDIGLVIFDECHHVAAEVLGKAMFTCCAKRVLGLSATPDRRDGLTPIVHLHMGPLAFRESRTRAHHVHVEIVEYSTMSYSAPMPTNRRGDVDYARIVTMLAEDDERTRVIVDTAARLARNRDGVLVLSHRRAHCGIIARGLQERGIDVALYLGGKHSATQPSARVVVATFALVSEGYDDPRLSGLVLATPASDVVQACGRIMRGTAAEAAPEIVDIVDCFGIARGQHAKRKRFYVASGFSVSKRTRECELDSE